jgi:hypothetical protein
MSRAVLISNSPEMIRCMLCVLILMYNRQKEKNPFAVQRYYKRAKIIKLALFFYSENGRF